MCFYLGIARSWLWMSHATFGFDFRLSTLPTRFANLSGKVVANVLVIATWVVSRPRNPTYISAACVTTTNFVLSRYLKSPLLLLLSLYHRVITRRFLSKVSADFFSLSLESQIMTLNFHNSLLNQTESSNRSKLRGPKIITEGNIFGNLKESTHFRGWMRAKRF